jgi:hypothetical protein
LTTTANVNRPGISGGSGCWLAGLGEGGVLTVVGGLWLDGRDVAAGAVRAAVVVPVDVFEGVAISMSSTLRHGPRGLISSVLNSPIVVSARALSEASPTDPTDGAAPAAASRSVHRMEVY